MQKNILKPILYKVAAFLALFTVLVPSLLPTSGAAAVSVYEDSGFWKDTVSYPTVEGANAAVLYEMEYGQVLYSHNADAVIYPASTVKIMSGLLACEMLEDRLDETVTVTSSMLGDVIGNSMKLQRGETVTVKDLLYGLIVGGYNDCANALAYLASGGQMAFVEAMNEAAAKLGASDTHFTNASGLHDEAMVTTARDITVIASYAMSCPLYRTVVSAESYTVAETNLSASRTFYNRNDLVTQYRTTAYYDERCLGLNAGSTDEGGYCVVTSTETDEGKFLCVVMGGVRLDSGTVTAYTQAKKLITWGYNSFSKRVVIEAGEEVLSLTLSGYATQDSVFVTVPEDVVTFMPKSLKVSDLTENQVRLTDSTLEAPVEKGSQVGYIRLIYRSENLGTSELVLGETVSLQGISLVLYRIRLMESNRIVIYSFLSFLVLALILTFAAFRSYRKRRKMSRYFANRRNKT